MAKWYHQALCITALIIPACGPDGRLPYEPPVTDIKQIPPRDVCAGEGASNFPLMPNIINGQAPSDLPVIAQPATGDAADAVNELSAQPTWQVPGWALQCSRGPGQVIELAIKFCRSGNQEVTVHSNVAPGITPNASVVGFGPGSEYHDLFEGANVPAGFPLYWWKVRQYADACPT